MNDDDFAELFKPLPSSASRETTWQDVLAEFETLGQTVGDLLRGMWERQDQESGLDRLRESLELLIADVNRGVEGSPEGQQAREQLSRFAESIRAAAERTGDELRPELLRMLRQANTELRRFTRLDE